MIVPLSPTTERAVPERWYYYLEVPAWAGGDPDKRAVEVVRGTEVEKKMGAFETGLANDLNRALAAHVWANQLGQSHVGMEIELTAVGTKRKPDVIFVSYQTWPRGQRIPPDAWWAVVPDLAVEVISPFDLGHAVIAKVQEYFLAGVRLVWQVWPNVEQVHVYSSPTAVRILTTADELTGDPVIPGFRMPVADLFPPPAPNP